jgi:hypothetical protein
MNEGFSDALAVGEAPHSGQGYHSLVSGSYIGQNGSSCLELRVDLSESPQHPYQPLDLVSGDLSQDAGDGTWRHRNSFIVEHPTIDWGPEQVEVTGDMLYLDNRGPLSAGQGALVKHILKTVIPLSTASGPSPQATVHIMRWGNRTTTYRCEKTSDFLRTIDLEIDRISGTRLPRTFQSHTLLERPPDLPLLDLSIAHSYRRAGVDLRLISDSEVFSPTEAGNDLKWDENELHNAMENHFSEWRDRPQWKLYLLVATHHRLYPDRTITGIMYDSHHRDPDDSHPRQGVAAFYSSMVSVWNHLSPEDFERNYLRTCVHELGHGLNLVHCFDQDRPSSATWMNYPWRYPHGYDLPASWDGTHDFWQDFRFEFDADELRHIRHEAFMDVVPGGAEFGPSVHDIAAPPIATAHRQQNTPVALYVRTRPERYLFDFTEPVTVELKLKNQTDAPVAVPDMLNPEFGMLELSIRDPRGRVRPYRPLFKLCGEARRTELPPGGKLYESVFIAYGADGFYFDEPGEYQIWAVYGASGQRILSNLLRVRVAFPRGQEDEEMALRAFGQGQGHVLYMRGADHLPGGNNELREVTERFPGTKLARYIHYCFGVSQAREFKDVVQDRIRQPEPNAAIQELEKARAFSPRWDRHSSLDNITHGRAIDLLSDLYRKTDQPAQAKSVLTQTARYFTRMKVKPEVIEDMRARAQGIGEEY